MFVGGGSQILLSLAGVAGCVWCWVLLPVWLQVGLRQSWSFPQNFPPCWESSMAPDGFPAPTEGPALGWLWHTVLGAGCKTRGWTGSTAQCWNPEGIGNCSPGCTGNTRIHQQLSHPWMAYCTQFPGTQPAPAAGSRLCFPAGPPEGEGNLEKPVPIPKNCPEHP